ncbi:molybdopterin-guanine dinucleotide biosynthesis protein MobB [Methanolinea mesophila]|uniref:molybdopterin-guanine dinucleotide biosynthesis protein B n=1 Tax=Methanolinea mesophila TaxID=547055 RepID=UPI001AE5DD3A|nr:molybdopterin-guanine dinucleotide biosynthesis protein B [Methanolinea mesophila]MBP1928392.1 molybdopterin-guanine dinucleotide biosynthesis protein MobB [Methanolinea mesophila]
MRVIHVAGLSGSGKTRFISQLVPPLRERGPVAVVKHLGHHQWDLQEGKDTTVFFESGAVSVGIDSRKSVMVMEEHDLETVLGMLDRIGMAFAVIEGFKQKPFPKIAIGGLPHPENVLFEDPPVELVLDHLDMFPEFHGSSAPGVNQVAGNDPFTLKLEIPAGGPEWDPDEFSRSVLAGMDQDYPGLRGSLVRSGPGEKKVSLQISAPDPRSAYSAMNRVLEKMREAIPYSSSTG